MDFFYRTLRNLGRKKLRTALTLSGIAIGVASVIIISTIGMVGKAAISNELDSLGIGGLAISTNKQVTSLDLYPDDLETIKSLEAVENAIPILVEYTTVKARNQQENCVLWGVDAGAKQVISLEARYGRLINHSDVGGSANVCLVDENYAQSVYKRNNIVGKTIEILINGTLVDFKVVGVVSSGGSVLQNLVGNYIPTFVYIPYSSMQRLLCKNYFDQIAVLVKDHYDVDSIGASISSALASQTGQKEAYRAENLLKQKEKMGNLLDIITLILSVIAGISLIVAGLSIMTVMLVSVSERTREIGIKKSIGARRFHILFEFLLEAFYISLIGCFIGIVFGLAVIVAGCLILKIEIILNMALILFCVGFSIVIGIIFGVYPAIKAASLKPVDALRFE